MSQILLTLNIPPELEEDLVDYLLSISENSGFTSYSVDGHGQHESLSIAEQVTGRRRRKQFEIILEPNNVTHLIEGLADNVGKDIRYWEIPISRQGSIN